MALRDCATIVETWTQESGLSRPSDDSLTTPKAFFPSHEVVPSMIKKWSSVQHETSRKRRSSKQDDLPKYLGSDVHSCNMARTKTKAKSKSRKENIEINDT